MCPLALRGGAGAGAATGATSEESGCEIEGGLWASTTDPSRQRRSVRPQAAVLELGGESGGPGPAPFTAQGRGSALQVGTCRWQAHMGFDHWVVQLIQACPRAQPVICELRIEAWVLQVCGGY